MSWKSPARRVRRRVQETVEHYTAERIDALVAELRAELCSQIDSMQAQVDRIQSEMAEKVSQKQVEDVSEVLHGLYQNTLLTVWKRVDVACWHVGILTFRPSMEYQVGFLAGAGGGVG